MSVLYWLEGIRNPVLNGVFSLFTQLGDETMFIVAAIVIFWCVSKKYGYYLMAAGVGGTVVNQTLKITFRVPRPWVKDPEFTIVESARAAATGYSFPSGHTQNGVVVWGGIARFTKRTWLRIAGIAVAVLIGVSRMYLGVHTPADVAVGAACGAVMVLGLYPVFCRSDEKPRNVVYAFGALAALALGAVLYVELRDWPADIDEANLASAVKNGYTMLGCALGALIAAPVERKYVNFDTKAPWWAQILKVLLGFGLMMGLKSGLKAPLSALFGGHSAANALRYGIMVFLAIAVWPMTFGWFGRGCPLGRKAKKALKIAGIVILCIAVIGGGIFWAATKDTPRVAPMETDGAENALITPLGQTMLSGHRAGGGIAPENTMAALENCVENGEYELDIFEFDLHLTADGALVLLHDSTLDRTSDAAEVFGGQDIDVGTKTLAELKTLNMGAKFEAEDGTMPYAGLTGDDVPDGVRITTLEEALAYLEESGEFRYIIEIKNSGEEGYAAADKLYATLVEFGCLDRTVVGTFHNEVTAYLDETYPDLPRSAGVMEVVGFFLRSLVNWPGEGDFGFDALQIPTTDYVVNLGTSRVVNYAHERGIAVQYWTINDGGEMARLQSIGADAIMTDVPDLGAAVLNQP